METIVNEFPEGTPGRTFVIACYTSVSLAQPEARLIEQTPPAHLLSGAMKEVLLTPHKDGVDVALARPSDAGASRAWIATSHDEEPRRIADPLLSPVASARYRHLTGGSMRQWAMAGGLQSIHPHLLNGRWQSQVCALPVGIATAYFSIAPEEQRFPSLDGSEVIWMETEAGRAWSRLPGIQLSMWVVERSPPERVAMVLDTVVLDLEGRQATLFWRGRIRRSSGAVVPSVASEMVLNPSGAPPARPPAWESGRRRSRPTQRLRHETVDLADGIPTGVTQWPSTQARGAAGEDTIRTSAPKKRRERANTPLLDSVSKAIAAASITLTPLTIPKKAALPFRPDPSSDRPPPPGESSPPNDKALPFAPANTETPLPDGARPPRARESPPVTQSVPMRPPRSERPRSPPLEPSRSERPAPPPPIPAEHPSLSEAPRVADPPAIENRPPIDPPALLSSEPIDAEEEEEAPDTTPRGEMAAEPVALEVIAGLHAEMTMGAVTFMRSLSEQGLALADFARERSRWDETIAEESQRGRHDLQRRRDDASMTRYEELRGCPISVDEYAQLLVAIERVNAVSVLGEMGLPSESLLVVTRVFSRRTAESAELRAEVRECVRIARQGD